jgi:hypothetical protein
MSANIYAYILCEIILVDSFSILTFDPYVIKKMICDTRNLLFRLSFFSLLHAFDLYPKSTNICRVFAFRSIAFARHRKAL